MPFRAAESAVTWAANGVDLREPLKPAPPADSHAITLPSRSLSDTIVLLKDVLMCAWPTGTFFLTFRRPPRAGLLGAGISCSTSGPRGRGGAEDRAGQGHRVKAMLEASSSPRTRAPPAKPVVQRRYS